MDKSKLLKFLNLTLSPNDGETLAAIKKSNLFLKENNLTWEDILNKKSEYKDEYIYLDRQFQIEKLKTIELEKDIQFLKKITKYLLIIIFISVIIILSLVP